MLLDFIQQFELTKNVTLNSKVCENSSWKHPILVAVNSAPNHIDHRNTVRRTWGKKAKELHLSYVFVVAQTEDEKTNKAIKREHNLYGDLISASFIDSWFNLTLKSTFILGWANSHCRDQWLMLLDDDTILIPQNLIDFVNDNGGIQAYQKTIYCEGGDVWTFVDDRPENKYYISRQVVPTEFTVDRCSGVAYLISPASVEPLYNACMSNKTQPKIWFEDIYVTGLAAEVAGVGRKFNGDIFVMFYAHLLNRIGGYRGKSIIRDIITVGNNGWESEYESKWNFIYSNYESLVEKEKSSLWYKLKAFGKI